VEENRKQEVDVGEAIVAAVLIKSARCVRSASPFRPDTADFMASLAPFTASLALWGAR
jgi:hypothetical protein